MAKKICFVIMGFGKKTDPLSGVTFDLNKTYLNIIKPAVINSGYECVRADEIQDSGIIDKSMYALLMNAELVIADISTYNPNAIYELGIRHAVRPYSTIILKEEGGKIPFDIDHTRIFPYKHLGDDIGATEAERCQRELKSLIIAVSAAKNVDSPLYEFFGKVTPPILPDEDYKSIIKELAEKEKHIFALVEQAHENMRNDDFVSASKNWEKANSIIDSEPYFIQQWALCKYKSKSPTESLALIDAIKIIGRLDPDGSTNDPETLGITGAIYKKFWLLSGELEYLDRAIDYYGKCFKIRSDYYTGENYALCMDLKAQKEEDADEKIYLKIAAKKTRNTIIQLLLNVVETNLDDRGDKKWIYATISNCSLAIGNIDQATEFEKYFLGESPDKWEIDTFNTSKELIHNLNK